MNIEMIARISLKRGGVYIAPKTTFSVASAETAKSLYDAGSADYVQTDLEAAAAKPATSTRLVKTQPLQPVQLATQAHAKSKPTNRAALIADIAAAIPKLLPDARGEDGRPKMRELRAALGYHIDKAELEEGWAAAGKGGVTKPADSAALVAAIVEAISKIPEGEYGGDGKPNVAKISEALGYRVTALERDAGWSAFKAAAA